MKPVVWTNYEACASAWPASGRHILAQFDDDSIIVYQAYRPAIAEYAVAHQRFGGEFSYARMSWIKPNFLWMMYRCGWAGKEGQERVRALRLPRSFFDTLLLQAVVSAYDARRHASREDWQAAVANSDVRLQWDPDHDPAGRPLQRRALQLGLRGNALRQFGLLSVEDITAQVLQQRRNLEEPARLQVPAERIYTPPAEATAAIDLDPPEAGARP